MLLEYEGHSVISFDRGEHAMEHFASASADLVLLDLNTNGISPHEFMEACNRHFGERRPVVGVLSAHPYIRVEAERMGADFWVLKPFDQNVLLTKIAECVAARELRLHQN